MLESIKHFFAMVVLTIAGCVTPKPATLPVRYDAAHCARPVETLIVFLPGAYDHADDLAAHGFVAAVRARDIAADVALVDATLPFYRDRDVVTRLDADVIGPARARGIRHFWLGGISLGGLGSLVYANEHRGVVDGLLLIAPYLGERTTTAEIVASGGLARWSPPGAIPPEDDDRRLWRWAKALTTTHDAALPSLYLGFGIDDRYAASHRVLAAALPPDRVFTVSGDHDWPAWQAAWPRMLDAAALPRGCAGASR
jgi:pimeloyl-ACP methyl ester carboxylesterase